MLDMLNKTDWAPMVPVVPLALWVTLAPLFPWLSWFAVFPWLTWVPWRERHHDGHTEKQKSLLHCSLGSLCSLVGTDAMLDMLKNKTAFAPLVPLVPLLTLDPLLTLAPFWKRCPLLHGSLGSLSSASTNSSILYGGMSRNEPR